MHKKKYLCYLCIIVTILLFGAAGYKLYTHELKQEIKIKDLMLSVQLLDMDIDEEKKEFIKNVGYAQGDVNVLFLGNSLTRHDITNYWWDEIGMAASEAEKDYYHVVVSEMSNIYDNVNSYAYNFSQWEISDHDRAQTIKLIDSVLLPQINILILQLGENISNTDTLESDLDYLITYIKSECPNADIIMVGNFWKDEVVESIKYKISSRYNLKYVSLKDLWDKKEFMAGMGAVVYDADGNEHKIEHSGVARHPGDRGMQAIADRIIKYIN